MGLFRFLGRSLFASAFIVDGVKLITDSDQAQEVAPTVEKVVPAARTFLSDDAAAKVPEDNQTWARIIGGTQVLGGAMYATGIGRRLGAILMSVTAVPRVLSALSSETKNNDLVGSLALLGGSIVATQDTHGAPDLARRAANARERLSRESETASKSLRKDAKLAKSQLQNVASDVELSARRGLGKAKQAIN